MIKFLKLYYIVWLHANPNQTFGYSIFADKACKNPDTKNWKLIKLKFGN